MTLSRWGLRRPSSWLVVLNLKVHQSHRRHCQKPCVWFDRPYCSGWCDRVPDTGRVVFYKGRIVPDNYRVGLGKGRAVSDGKHGVPVILVVLFFIRAVLFRILVVVIF